MVCGVHGASSPSMKFAVIFVDPKIFPSKRFGWKLREVLALKKALGRKTGLCFCFSLKFSCALKRPMKKRQMFFLTVGL